jgi:RNA polymerase sigma-70 factor, ECF subfamily
MVEVDRRPTSVTVAEIEAVYRSRIGRLRRVARAITGDAETARDVVQEAFASAIGARARFRPTGSLEAWLWRIVVNRALDEKRRARRVVALAPRTSAPDASGISEAVAALPERQRVAVFLHYYADLDYGAIGHALGISPGTVGALLHTARGALREALTPKEAVR